MNEKFSKRRELLSKIIGKGETIQLTKSIITDDPKKIEEFFLENIENGLEGIIAKDLNAPYIAGARKFAWIKLKRSYKGELSDSVDVTIIGYFKGKGKRTEFGLGGLLTAVYDEETDSFKSICKIGSGMSEEMLKELKQKLEKISKKEKPARVDSKIEPDAWVLPNQVIEVRADEITRSPLHTCGMDKTGQGYALRFPRMIKFREKKPEESTTVKEIIEMYNKQTKTNIMEEENQ
jgi:DNA ligase-1